MDKITAKIGKMTDLGGLFSEKTLTRRKKYGKIMLILRKCRPAATSTSYLIIPRPARKDKRGEQKKDNASACVTNAAPDRTKHTKKKGVKIAYAS